MKSITQRWIKNSLMFTLTLLIFVEIIFVFFTYSNFYADTRQAIYTRISTMEGQLQSSISQSETEISFTVRRMVEEFGEKEKFEIMILDKNGGIVSTSSGFLPSYDMSKEDLNNAYLNAQGIGEYIGETNMGESILSISFLLPKSGEDAVALRFVTSLTQVNRQIIMYAVLSTFIVAVIFLFSILSGLYFVRSIVQPVGEMEISAKRIAEGDFNTRLDVKPKSNDEISRLSLAINHMAEELGKTEQMKNEFISSVSHELRTPLTSIKGWTETLAKVNDPTHPNYKHGMKVIAQETDRLYGMVEELLDFSRIENKGLLLNTEKLDIVAEVTDAYLMMGQRASLEGITLEYDEPEEMIAVIADRNRLRQVFINIIDNAFKYSPKGGTVTIKIMRTAQLVAISIEDMGKGIEPDDLDNVRLKFYKGKGSVRGSGIGLAVVQEILEAHSGQFTIDSTVGKGTNVTVYLPIA